MLVTVNFGGVIDSRWGDSWVATGFAVGQSFTGSYVFETTTPGVAGALNDATGVLVHTQFGGVPPQRTVYPAALSSFSATSGGNTITPSGASANGILIDNELYGGDNYFVILDAPASSLYLDLRGSGLFASSALPAAPPTFAALSRPFLRVRTIGGAGAFAYAEGRLNSLA